MLTLLNKASPGPAKALVHGYVGKGHLGAVI